MIIGYARVSTTDQKTDMQIDALEKAECTKIFEEKLSGRKDDRPELEKCLAFAREGDTLVVWKLDRLGRSLPHLVQTIKSLGERKIMFRSLKENIDTSTAAGKLVFHIFASLAEFECEMIRERTKSGLKAAKDRGSVIGRPRKIKNPQEAQTFARLCKEGATARKIREELGLSDTTYHRMKKEFKTRGTVYHNSVVNGINASKAALKALAGSGWTSFGFGYGRGLEPKTICEIFGENNIVMKELDPEIIAATISDVVASRIYRNAQELSAEDGVKI